MKTQTKKNLKASLYTMGFCALGAIGGILFGDEVEDLMVFVTLFVIILVGLATFFIHNFLDNRDK